VAWFAYRSGTGLRWRWLLLFTPVPGGHAERRGVGDQRLETRLFEVLIVAVRCD